MVKIITAFLLSAVLAVAQLGPHSDQAFLGQFFPTSSGPGDDYATGWAARVVANGGAAPSAGTKSAISTFINMLNTANLTNKMYNVNIIAPDSLIAIRTPLIYTKGTDPYGVGANFPDANRSVNGYTGTGVSSFFLNLGFRPDDLPGIATNVGYSIYYYTTVNESRNDFGCFDGSTREHGLSYINQTHRGEDGTFPGGRFDVSNAGFGGGMVSYNVTTNVGKFWGGSSAGFGQIGGNDNTLGDGALNGLNYYFFTQNASGSAQNGCTKTISFLAVHTGLNQMEASNLWYAVQVLRTNLGGGYK